MGLIPVSKVELKTIWQNACIDTDNARNEWVAATNQEKPKALVALYWSMYLIGAKAEKVAFNNYFNFK
ncbi:MAG: hypothetical protein ACRCUJ_06845 [Phocaeicola sp.]